MKEEFNEEPGEWVTNIPQSDLGTKYTLVGGKTGAPKPTDAYTVQELEKIGTVGVYKTSPHFALREINPSQDRESEFFSSPADYELTERQKAGIQAWLESRDKKSPAP